MNKISRIQPIETRPIMIAFVPYT